MDRLVQITKPGNERGRCPERFVSDSDLRDLVPVHAVWELTLACNLKCNHCGSRAGKPRANELSSEECLEVVDALARLGTREITLIGGESYLRKDWLEIVRAVGSHGIRCTIQTGGRALTDRRLDAAVEAGLQGLGVSIDGLEELHDRLRGVPGSHAMAIDAVRRAKSLGLPVGCNTQIGPETPDQLPRVMDEIIDAGASHWQLQLTVAMGNAVDNDQLLLQPFQLLDLMPLLARLNQEGRSRGLLMMVGNNIGYFGPYENTLRGEIDQSLPHWTGCAAGQAVIGIESDGTVKGCPSLATSRYAGGNIRDLTLEQIWHTAEAIHFGRLRSVKELWGFCRDCYYSEICRAGCTWTGDSLFGKPGNNPYCHYRALELARQGLRERVVKVEEAPPDSFAIGRFELVTEPLPGAEPNVAPQPSPRLPDWVAPSDERTDPRHEGRRLLEMDLCRACDCFIWPGEQTCPHCHANVAEAAAAYEVEVRRQQEVIAELQALLGQAGV